MLISEIKPEDAENFINLIKKIETEVMNVDAFGFGEAFHRNTRKNGKHVLIMELRRSLVVISFVRCVFS